MNAIERADSILGSTVAFTMLGIGLFVIAHHMVMA
jgi:hypothetical protein